MSASAIEWTERTWNPVVGCSVISAGCTNCYAMTMAGRLEAMFRAGQDAMAHYGGTTQPSKAGAVWTGTVNVAPDAIFLAPLKRRKPTTWFVNSMSDLFHDSVPDDVIDRVFAVMALCPQHRFQVLTKRSERMRAYLDRALGRIAAAVMDLRQSDLAKRAGMGPSGIAPLPHIRPGAAWWPLANVCLGVSVEDQRAADTRIPDLLATPAAVRFLSCEPLLGPVNLDCIMVTLESGDEVGWNVVRDGPGERIDWVIVGGESGPAARPMHPDWARGLRDQCAAAGVPFFFKQWGEWGPIKTTGHGDPRYPADPPIGERMERLGKKAAGRLLDGVQHDGMPA